MRGSVWTPSFLLSVTPLLEVVILLYPLKDNTLRNIANILCSSRIYATVRYIGCKACLVDKQIVDASLHIGSLTTLVAIVGMEQVDILLSCHAEAKTDRAYNNPLVLNIVRQLLDTRLEQKSSLS